MSENNKVISEATPIRIGLVILFLGVFGTGVWWASSINSKLDSIISSQAITTTSVSDLRTKTIDLDKEIADIKLSVALNQVEIRSIKEKPNAVK